MFVPYSHFTRNIVIEQQRKSEASYSVALTIHTSSLLDTFAYKEINKKWIFLKILVANFFVSTEIDNYLKKWLEIRKLKN